MAIDAYIYDAIRTPRGKGRENGALHPLTATDLLVQLMTRLQQRQQLDTAQIDDVILGCVTPVGEQGADIPRTAILAAGWDVGIAGVQINRFCPSGLEAVNMAAMKVRSGWEKLIVAGGVESMSRVPMGSDGGALMQDPLISDQIGFVPQGISADLIATLENFSRDDVDQVALLSQQRAMQATINGYFKSLLPIVDAAGHQLLATDQHIRPNTTLDALAALPPVFQKLGEARFDAIALRKYPQIQQIKHVHTAGNSSGIVDGAALVLVGSKAQGEALKLKPCADPPQPWSVTNQPLC